MPLDVVMGAVFFFVHLREELTNSILSYLKTQDTVEIPQDLRDSLQNGIGTLAYTDLLRATLQN
jgi:hypothetical protein